MAASPAIALKNIVKCFGKVRALDGVSLSVGSGEILALVGENGAGKSTLMKVLSGVYPSGTFEGEIELEGKPMHFSSPAEAEHHGIAIIHQELSAFAHLTVLENLFVGRWPAKFGIIDDTAMRTEAAAQLARLGQTIPLDTPMRELSTGNQQLVEIAKALSRNPKVLILDEPTSSLTGSEIERLFSVLSKLKAEGRAMVFISHKMDEIFSLCDRIVVIRDGKSVHHCKTSEIDPNGLIAHMVGRSLDHLFPEKHADAKLGATVLEVKDLEIDAKDRSRTFGPYNFNVRKGEIVGFAGLLGAGRTELAHALVGASDASHSLRGQIILNGREHKVSDPKEALESRIAIVGEDRKRDSIFPGRSLTENATLSQRVKSFLLNFIKPKEETEVALSALKEMKTRFSELGQSIEELSGGNQQKVVIARTLATNPEVLILDEPTRGVDVGAKYEIAQKLFEFAAKGQALIVMSSDLPELIGLCDRIFVMSEGKITRELSRPQFSQEEIMRAAVRGHQGALA